MADPPFRILPKLTEHNRDFWTGGANGELRFLRCQDRPDVHPSAAADLPEVPLEEPRVRTGVGQGDGSYSYTINYQPWMPGPELPYTVAIVEIVEDPTVRLTTNLVNCPHDEIAIDMPLRVTFEHHADPEGDVYLPMFEPDPEA